MMQNVGIEAQRIMSRKISDLDLASRKTQVVEAASGVFLRYGYARTTMADLAGAARLSRPTLYELFPGKDELFSAVIHHLSEKTLQGYRDRLPKLRTTRTRLHGFCGDWGTHGFRLSERHPDAKDLFDFGFPAVREMYEDFIQFLVGVISSEPHAAKVPLEKVVRNLVFSLSGLKQAARDVGQMEELIGLQIDIFLASLSPPK